jgi:phosphoribosylamine--glycine ligase
MKILVVGSGGREHAIAWRLAQDSEGHVIFCAPGNAGTADIATNVPIKAEDVAGIVAWAKAERPDLVVVGPEAPLVAGLVDALAAEGIVAFGPTAAGARMEGSKRFAKEVMSAAGVPTGRAEIFTDAEAAKSALPGFGLPVVIKADGLAAGKGVVVAETLEQACGAVDDMLVGGRFGSAGAEILVEEFLHGEECSILAVVDGNDAVLLPGSQDHKRIFDGDKGPNTGGMGAYSPAPVVKDEMLPEIKERIIMPVVRELAKRGIVYRGVLYAGLMIDTRPEAQAPDGCRASSGSLVNVVEFNARFGDPETQVVLPRLKNDIIDVMEACVDGTLDTLTLEFEDKAAVCVVLASDGYPLAYEKGLPISGFENFAGKDDYFCFHAGTKFNEKGEIVTNGGRVLGITATGSDLKDARAKAYDATEWISFANKYMRHDIGKAIDDAK